MQQARAPRRARDQASEQDRAARWEGPAGPWVVDGAGQADPELAEWDR